jgi:hypothetical protein
MPWRRTSIGAGLNGDRHRQNPNAVTLSLLLQSLNDIFDRQSELMSVVANRVRLIHHNQLPTLKTRG